MTPSDLSCLVKRIAEEIGFDACGIAAADPIGRADYIREWLDSGQAGTMAYMHRHLPQRLDPRVLLPRAKSVIMVALSYHAPTPPVEPGAERGRVARYAWGLDYHKVVKRKLFDLADALRAEAGVDFEAKACVDTAPLMERALAGRAGIGWIGKSTMLVSTRLGTYFVLGGLVTTLAIPPDEPAKDRCGTCTACIDACPTKAITAAHRMDASRCVSYLTIEFRGDQVPESLSAGIGDWLFGCDVCQEVCPYNRRAAMSSEPRFTPRPPAPSLSVSEVLSWSEADRLAALQGRAIKRATLAMLKRNARIVQRNLARQAEA